MFLFNWFWDILSYFGLGNKKARILFLGLDNAGKTTLLHMLKDDRVAQHVPTLHPHSEELIVGKLRLVTFDLGGHETARRIWKDYFAAVDAIVFIVDATDRARLPEAREELHSLFETPELNDVPIVVLGNKIDNPMATSEDEMRAHVLQRPEQSYMDSGRRSSRVGPVEVFMCSVIKRMGYADAFRWLAQHLN